MPEYIHCILISLQKKIMRTSSTSNTTGNLSRKAKPRSGYKLDVFLIPLAVSLRDSHIGRAVKFKFGIDPQIFLMV